MAITVNQFRGLFLTANKLDWDALYAEQLPRVYNFLRYRVEDDAVAEDLTAMTFEKAWQHRARFDRDKAAFNTWLFTIARNVAIDYFRAESNTRRTTVSLDDETLNVHAPSSESEAARREQFHRLHSLLGELPEREREIVALKYGADMSNRDIAAVLKLSESNVGTIAHRVVQQLRQRWEK